MYLQLDDNIEITTMRITQERQDGWQPVDFCFTYCTKGTFQRSKIFISSLYLHAWHTPKQIHSSAGVHTSGVPAIRLKARRIAHTVVHSWVEG